MIIKPIFGYSLRVIGQNTDWILTLKITLMPANQALLSGEKAFGCWSKQDLNTIENDGFLTGWTDKTAWKPWVNNRFLVPWKPHSAPFRANWTPIEAGFRTVFLQSIGFGKFQFCNLQVAAKRPMMTAWTLMTLHTTVPHNLPSQMVKIHQTNSKIMWKTQKQT